MNRNTRFWISLAVFQVVFGLAVFAITRDYYKVDVEQVDVSFDRPDAFASIDPALAGTVAIAQDPARVAREADEQFAAGQYARAAALYEQLLAFDPGNVDTLNNLGLTLHYVGRSDEALQRLNEGTALDPSYQRIWLTLGYVNSGMGNGEAAREALSTAVGLNPDNNIGRSAAALLSQLPGS